MALELVQSVIGINQEYLDEWIAYREEDLKKPMTPRAIKMLTKKLLQWSESEQERLICNAIEMNWRGVYWTEPPNKDGSNGQNRLKSNSGASGRKATPAERVAARHREIYGAEPASQAPNVDTVVAVQ